MSAIWAGSENTMWKYGTGNSSASRAASHSLAAAPWHLGQCRLRQELYAIWVWPHLSFSQRATWPPSAAVRQFAIADITLSWPRLTWPALAWRHAGPWRRKISATSSFGRANSAASGWRLDLGLFVSLLLGRVFGVVLDLVRLGPQRREAVERAHHLTDRVGGDARVERCRLQLGMSEKHLNHANIDILLKQVSRKAVPQSMGCHALLEVGHLGSGMAGARELTCRYRVGWVLARKQPSLRPRDAIPIAQKFKQRRGKHRIAILATLALLDAQHHAFGIDIGDLQ